MQNIHEINCSGLRNNMCASLYKTSTNGSSTSKTYVAIFYYKAGENQTNTLELVKNNSLVLCIHLMVELMKNYIKEHIQ